MFQPFMSSQSRLRRTMAVLATAMLLAWTIPGCSTSNEGDGGQTVDTVKRQASETSRPAEEVKPTSGTEDLATVCSEADLTSVENASAGFADAQRDLMAAIGDEPAFASATVVLLDKGVVLFSSIASTLDTFFDELAQTSGQSAIADTPDDLRTAADRFSVLATDIEKAGTVTGDDIAAIQAIGTMFDEFGSDFESGSPGGDEVRQIAACETLVRDLDVATSAASATDGDDEIDEVGTDPSDDACNQDRWLEDSDCGDPDVPDSDRADGACDNTYLFTDPDC